LSAAIKIMVPVFLGPYLPFLPQINPVLRKMLSGVRDPNSPIHRLSSVLPAASKGGANWIHGFRHVEMSSGGIISNAHTLAYLASVMSMGGKEEKKNITFLSPEAFARAQDGRVTAPDYCLGDLSTTFGNAGFADMKGFLSGDGWQGWAGFGGSLFVWNREHNLGVGYVMNGMHAHYATGGKLCGLALEASKHP